MKQLLYIFFISIFVISCTSNTIYKKPENLIPKDQMVDLLVDMQLALGAKSIKNIDGNKNIEYIHLVFEKYGIDSARFAESNFYYMTDIDEFNKILKKTKNRIHIMKKDLESIKAKNDSIENASKPELDENPQFISKIDTTARVK